MKQESNKDKLPPSLSPKHVFGIRSDLPNNIQFFSGDKCAYVAGFYVVICSVKGNVQNFFPALPDYGEITSFCVDESPDTIVLSIAQRTKERSCLYVRFISKQFFTVDSNKTSKIAYIDDEYIMSQTINYAKGFLVALVGPKVPSSVLIYQFDYKGTPKISHHIHMTMQTPYINVCYNFHNPNLISIYGDGGCAIIQTSDQDKKVNKLEIVASTFAEFSKCVFNIVSCAWINKNRVAFLNNTCDVFIFDFSTKSKLETPHRRLIKWTSIFDMQSRGKGIFSKNGNLFVAKDDAQIVKLEEDKQTDSKDMLYVRNLSAPKFTNNLPRVEIHTLSVNNPLNSMQNYSAVLMSTENSQIYYLDISNDNAIHDGTNYKVFMCNFHSDEIIALDVAKWKQLVATCSKDRSIKIWNYINLQLEVSETFEDEPIGLSFHPNGLHLAVLFRDKFRLMHVLEKSIVPYKEYIVFQPNDIKFSNFGHMFSISYKSFFQIYNFYTCEVIINSKTLVSEGNLTSHTDELNSITWDIDDSGFSTCGSDGRIIYWSLVSKDSQLVDFYNKDFRFSHTDIQTLEDYTSKKIFAIDENNLVEVYSNAKETTQIIRGSSLSNQNAVLKHKVLLQGKFSQLFFDQDSKLLITSSAKAHSYSLTLIDYLKFLANKDTANYAANALGINSMRVSEDMTHLFTCGKDRCLFFFNLNNVSKMDKTNEIFEPENLVLVKKDDLEEQARELKQKIDLKDGEITKEEEKFEDESKAYLTEIRNYIEIYNIEEEKFNILKEDYDERLKQQLDNFEQELLQVKEEYNDKLETLIIEHNTNMQQKEKDKERENENLHNEKKKDEAQKRSLYDKITEEERRLKETHKIIKEKLIAEKEALDKKNKELIEQINRDKSEKMDDNDSKIAEKRRELENLKKYYEKTKMEHREKEEELKTQIKIIKEKIRERETKLANEKNELLTLQSENMKMEKQIKDMYNDKLEKEETIKDKNALKRKLEKDNQELEKFKYVLHYKIKELKHNKEPKERRIQQLEKQAKDMEREIKNFEMAQDNYIINLSNNHQVIKLHEKQIGETEKRIERLKSYKKLFQESVYHAMKKAKNHKDLKKEIVNLKRLFLDKEFIEIVEKPYETNYELQREFLENNVEHYNSKIKATRKIFNQDHSKVMRENMKLIDIVNKLEKEKKEIEVESEEELQKSTILGKTKLISKAPVPKFGLKEDGSIRQKEAQLKKELFELEKEIQLIKYWKKKEKEDQAKEEKKNKIMNSQKNVLF